MSATMLVGRLNVGTLGDVSSRLMATLDGGWLGTPLSSCPEFLAPGVAFNSGETQEKSLKSEPGPPVR